MILFGPVSFTLTIAMGIAGVILVKRTSFTDDVRSLKAITKFVFFVLIGNTVSLIAQLIPLLRFADLSSMVVEYTVTFVTFISLYPTPILILVYFKQIERNWKTLKRFAYNWKMSY